jgi:hypothetical protein
MLSGKRNLSQKSSGEVAQVKSSCLASVRAWVQTQAL